MNNVHIVIMAGGTGTRFWPYSRNEKPKQFVDALDTGRSLLQMTYDRFKGFVPDERMWIVSNAIYEDLLSEQLPEIPKDNVLLEPYKRNTAPCIAYTAYKIQKKDPNAIMVILPSDHVIFKEEAFLQIIEKAVSGCISDTLVTIGIKPNRPETGYGYIQFDSEVETDLKPVKTFTEKPDADLAEKFISSGDFVWNAGIFVWSVESITRALAKLQPSLAETFSEGIQHYFTDQEESFIQKAYSHSKSISIDYAVMEKSDNVQVVLGEFGWSDLGSWNALHEIKDKDENQNVIEADAMLYDCKDNYVISKSDRLIVMHKMKGYLIADFEDVLLVCKKEDSGVFRDFVNDVKLEKGDKLI
ncbi:MAG: mannose-1-phosphate guanylyltransferase [Cyclobacteriaceae bacterium]